MFRYQEIEGVTIRYDGTETRLCVDRYREFGGLTTIELGSLIRVLADALDRRLRFDARPVDETREKAGRER